MKSIIGYVSLFLVIGFLTSCDSETKPKDGEGALIDAVEGVTKENFSETENAYVLAEGGLRMREEPNLTSKKLEVLAYGSKVQTLSTDAAEVAPVAGLTGKMVKTMQGNKKGYAFDGYLSSIPVPENEQTIEEYVKVLKKEDYNASFNYIESNDGMQAEDVFSIPAKNLQEAFLIGQRLNIFDLNFDLNRSPNDATVTVKRGMNTIKGKKVDDPDGELGDGIKYDVPVQNTENGANYWMQMIRFDFDNNQVSLVEVQVAYEGGSWTCTLQKEGENYVFRKLSTAD